MTQPISSNHPPHKHEPLETQDTASVQQRASSSKTKPPSLMFLIARLMLETLSVITNGMSIRSQSISQNQASAEAALQMNSAEHLVQVDNASGVALGTFTQETDTNSQIQQVRLVINGDIQLINTQSSTEMTNESAQAQLLSATYQQASGALQTIVTTTFAANLTQAPH